MRAEDRLEEEVQVESPDLPVGDETDDFRDENLPDLPSLPPHVMEVINRMYDGTEPLPRPLHKYEAKRFNARHVLICVLRTAGFTRNEIAKMVNYSRASVTWILNHPYGKQLIKLLMGVNSVRVFDIRTRLEEHAVELMDHVAGLALMSEDIKEIREVTFGFLDRAGYSPKTTVDMHHTVVREEPTKSAPVLSRLAAAMEESNRVNSEIMPNWTPASPPDVGGGRIGTPDQLTAESGPVNDAPTGTSP